MAAKRARKAAKKAAKHIAEAPEFPAEPAYVTPAPPPPIPDPVVEVPQTATGQVVAVAHYGEAPNKATIELRTPGTIVLAGVSTELPRGASVPAPVVDDVPKPPLTVAQEAEVRRYGHVNGVPASSVDSWLQTLRLNLETKIVYQEGRVCGVIAMSPSPHNYKWALKQANKASRRFLWNERLANL